MHLSAKLPIQFDNNHNIIVKEFTTSKYGYQGWSIEEILTEVMGMKSVHSELFSSMLTKFDKAIDNGDISTAKSCYAELDIMLHPSNPLRKKTISKFISMDR